MCKTNFQKRFLADEVKSLGKQNYQENSETHRKYSAEYGVAHLIFIKFPTFKIWKYENIHIFDNLEYFGKFSKNKLKSNSIKSFLKIQNGALIGNNYKNKWKFIWFYPKHVYWVDTSFTKSKAQQEK